jgi:hypothetical protein
MGLNDKIQGRLDRIWYINNDVNNLMTELEIKDQIKTGKIIKESDVWKIVYKGIIIRRKKIEQKKAIEYDELKDFFT